MQRDALSLMTSGAKNSSVCDLFTLDAAEACFENADVAQGTSRSTVPRVRTSLINSDIKRFISLAQLLDVPIRHKDEKTIKQRRRKQKGGGDRTFDCASQHLPVSQTKHGFLPKSSYFSICLCFQLTHSTPQHNQEKTLVHTLASLPGFGVKE